MSASENVKVFEKLVNDGATNASIETKFSKKELISMLRLTSGNNLSLKGQLEKEKKERESYLNDFINQRDKNEELNKKYNLLLQDTREWAILNERRAKHIKKLSDTVSRVVDIFGGSLGILNETHSEVYSEELKVIKFEKQILERGKKDE